jgi:hypothetical protein
MVIIMSVPVQNDANSTQHVHIYEFNEQENKVFRKLSRHILINAFLFMLGGLLFYVLALVNIANAEITPAVSFFFDGILQFAIGLSIIRSYDNFNNIISTEGSDIPELIQGLKDLDFSFRLTSFFVVLIIVIEYALGMI